MRLLGKSNSENEWLGLTLIATPVVIPIIEFDIEEEFHPRSESMDAGIPDR